MKNKKRIKTLKRLMKISRDIDVNLLELIPTDVMGWLAPELSEMREEKVIGFKYSAK